MIARFALLMTMWVVTTWPLVAQAESKRVLGLRAGAAIVDISPDHFPAVVSGGFFERLADRLEDRLHARALVLDDGSVRLALVVVDSLMMPRELLDDARQRACRVTGIPEDRIMISATHTHLAPSVMGALGTGVDEPYARRLPGWIATVIEQAAAGMSPVRVGWAVAEDPAHTHCRRWIHRPDKVDLDPFGERTVRAMMHPGYQNPDYIGPAGPVDTGLSLLAVQSLDGRPVAVLANYSMHYFGGKPVSADYFGRFCEKLAKRIASSGREPVVILSQGTSGDLHWMDYSQPKKNLTIDAYAEQVAEVALNAYHGIRYQEHADLAMAERKLTLTRRVADEHRLAWARNTVASMAGAKPTTKAQLYAQEQLLIHDQPRRELRLQAIRIGDLGITAIPDEVFGITGLKLKAQSPLVPTFNIELANGAEGYIPPPSQHKLGGYTTWAARTASLEVQAEPKIVEAVLGLLEQVSGKPRRKPASPGGAYAEAVLSTRPVAYWRLDDFEGPVVADATGRHPGRVEGEAAYYLEGPDSPRLANPGSTNRSVHLAGGWFECPGIQAGAQWSVELWFWNGLPSDLRAVTGCLVSVGRERVEIGGASSAVKGDSPALAGANRQTVPVAGRLAFTGLKRPVQGKTVIAPKTWNHLVVARDRGRVTIYLNGQEELSASADGVSGGPIRIGSGGQADSSFEGKIDEVAIYDRPLNAAEAARHGR